MLDMDKRYPSSDEVYALTKAEARARAYAALRAAKAARFPFPIEGRIPNFAGAEAAARRLRELPAYQAARAVKVNPDAPQLPVRAMVLEDGKTLYMPSPRLRGAFLRIRPQDVPPGQARRAASLSHCREYGEEISVAQLAEFIKESAEGAGDGPAAPDGAPPAIGLVVAGSDRKSTRLNSSHVRISYAVFCLKKKNTSDAG